MTDFESKGGHEHIRGRGFEALDTKSTWSSFDDIAWDDFGGDDHSVPEPDERAPSLWLRRKKDSKFWKDIKEEDQPSKMDAESTTMDVDNWDSLNVGELGTVPDNLTSIGNDLKQESPDSLPLLDGGVAMCLNEYNDGAANIVASSGHFSFSAVPSEEEMALFGGENDTGKVLSYAWENLEDMDNLFQSEEAAFAQDATDALLQWPTSSSSPDSNSPATNAKAACPSPELRAMKGKSHDQDMKMEFIPCESFDKNTDACPSNAEAESAATDLSELKFTAHEEQQSDLDKAAAEDAMEPLLSPKGKHQVSDADKAHSGKRQASNRKRSDERFRKQIYPRRPGINYAKQQPLTHFSSSHPLQLKPTVASTLQVYPQVIGPAVMGTMHHRPQYIGPVHSSYLIQPGQSQHSQAVMMCYDQADQQRFCQETRQNLAPPPPVSGTHMTPQEKIEKLRWKQKMHRLASEQHQQMAKQCGLSIDQCAPQQGARSQTSIDEEKTATAVKTEDGDGARAAVVETAVLSQLLSIMSKLDVGARICIRDALYRLARSAITRHTCDGPSSSEGSNNSAGDSAIRYPLLETETNPIDRTIANLLFHKRSSSNSSNANTANNNNNNNNSSISTASVVNIPCLQENQALWAWQQQQQEIGLSPSHHRQQQQQQQELRSSEITTPDEKNLGEHSTDGSSENAEEVSDGCKRNARPGGGGGYVQSVKSHRKREASSSEVLSNEEGDSPRTGRGACSSSSNSSRDHGKAAKTGGFNSI